MSFCPTKDIHSVYLDNELPDVYKAEYEKHLTECEKCRNELAKLKAVRSVFQADVASITPDKQFLDDSYQRLMIKMSYEKNSKKIKKPFLFKVGYAVSAAAAAVLFAVFIPLGLNSRKNIVEPDMPPVIDRMLSMQQFGNNVGNKLFGSGNNIAVSGNMDGGILSSNNYVNYIDYGNYDNVNYGGYLDKNYNYTGINLFDYMEGVDALRPQFTEDDIISIRVTIPNVNDVSIDLDNVQRSIVLSGNYLWNLLEN